MLNIAEIRKEKGITQLKLAEILDIGQSNLSNWERGITEPDMQSLVKIANVLEVSTDYLLGRTNDIGNIEIETSLSKDEEELVSLYRRMSFGDKNKLVGFAKGLVG